jgi:hypothetical protein
MMIFDLTVDTVLVCYCTDMDENMARHNGDSAYKIAVHMHADKLTPGKHKNKGKEAQKEKEGAKASKATAAVAPEDRVYAVPESGAPPRI